MEEKLLADFIYWLREKEDVYYAFDNPEEVVQEFLNKDKSLNEDRAL